jgi:uncharacterized protein (DUF1778 family)
LSWEVIVVNYVRPKAELKQRTTITTRVPLHLKQRWQEAAALRGLTLTDFLITAVNDATGNVFEEEDRVQLSERDSLLLAKMLARVPRLNERLREAIHDELEQMN